MQDASTARFPTVTVRIAALWIAVGAIFKLVAGTPNDLPPVVREFAPFGWDPSPGVILRLAVSIELVFVFTALLRPRWGWPWIAAQYVLFLAVLTSTVLEVQRSALEPVPFMAAMFDAEASCGCFGSSVKVAPGTMMVVDGLLLLMLLASRPWRGRLGAWGPEWLPTGFVCLAVVLPWMVRSTGGAPVKPPTTSGTAPVAAGTDGTPAPVETTPGEEPVPAEDWWVGLSIEQLDYVEIPLADWDGSLIYDVTFRPRPDDPDAGPAPFWTVLGLEDEVGMLPTDATFVLYRDACEHCAAHIQELASTDTGARALVFVRIPESGDAQDLVQLDQMFPEGTPHVSRLRLPEGPPYVFTTPGDFQVDGGVVSMPREAIGR